MTAPFTTLDKIPFEVVKNIKLLRLGVFENKSFEFVELTKKSDYPPHSHEFSEAEFYFIIGKGRININGTVYFYKEGSKYSIPKRHKHSFFPEEDTLFLSIQSPPIKNPNTGEEDIHF